MIVATAVKEALVAAFVSAALFVPIVGLVLRGRELELEFDRVVTLVALVFVGRLAVSLWARLRPQRPAAAPAGGLRTALGGVYQALDARQHMVVFVLLALLVAVPFAPFASNYLIQIMSLTLIYVMLAMGLNIVVGLAGLLDLGFVAFYAVGAYGYALLAQHLGLSFWWAIPTTAGLAALAGCLLGFPVLRMHGDYLAIVTLGFGEIIRILLVNMIDVTGGPNGMSAPRPTLFGLEFTRSAREGGVPFHEFFGIEYSAQYRYIFVYLVALAFAVLAIFVFRRLREMPIGRAWEALREDEIASKALGINYLTTKLSAFTLGAAFGGIGGVLFAAMEGFINPSSFTFIESAIILSMVVLGGMGSILGVVLAAVGITLLPELFREFEQFRMLVFGLAMVFVMVWRPGGLLKVRRRTFIADAPPPVAARPAVAQAD
jgi:branched-chain amino acid transport system permease protein